MTMRKISMIAFSGLVAISATAQSVTDSYTLSQNDLRGTARFMSMGGAFGALGGDLSVLSQNPGGIGIYRSHEIGLTVDLDRQSTKSESSVYSNTEHKTNFYLNNIGGVATMKLKSETCPNLNFGFSYNRVASFNKRYKGTIGGLRTSLSNYIAGISNSYGLTEDDVRTTDSYDPYNPQYNQNASPWISILGYDSYLTNPEQVGNSTRWYGQYGEGTQGTGYFDVLEKGGVDEYNIAIGGNIKNIVYWGIDFGITSIDYRLESGWEENLTNAYVYNPNKGEVQKMQANWLLSNNYSVNGSGFNFKMGVIVKPIQELRLGFAFHTPTYYRLSQTLNYGEIDYRYGNFNTSNNSNTDYAITNDGYSGYSNINFHTPWRVIASVAGVIGSKVIISGDYEWNGYRNMGYSEADYGYSDPWWDYDNGWYDPWYGWYGKPGMKGAPTASRAVGTSNSIHSANSAIKKIYQDTHTIRLGAEYRVISALSLRAGYSFKSSPVSSDAAEDKVSVPSTVTIPNYRLDNVTNYVTLGLGFKHKGFYADLAYVYKHMGSTYYPFSPDPENLRETLTKSKLSFSTSQVALSIGYKF